MKKECFKCNEVKGLDGFYKHPMMADGHLNKCKECTKKDVKENYEKNIHQYAKYESMRFHRPERKKQVVEYHRRRKHHSPEKVAANYMVSNAIRSGKLIRGKCEVCGTGKRIEAHHEDYSKPLDVVWLCRKHHLETHGKRQIHHAA